MQPAASHAATWSSRALALAMASHSRLGADAPAGLRRVAASRDLLAAILRHLSLVVPDDVPTLSSALAQAAPWQSVLLRSGEHLVDARVDGKPGSSVLRLTSPVRLRGERGTILRGTIVAEAGCAGGSMSDLSVEDAGDCCLRCEGGVWDLRRLRLRCAHGAALKASNGAKVELHECVMGGEAKSEMGVHVVLSAYGSVQDHGGTAKHACYALVTRDDADVRLSGCVLRECSEAAILLAQRSCVRLHGCHVSRCAAAFIAGQGRGRALELSACVIERSTRTLWADDDRPRAFAWAADNTTLLRSRREPCEAVDDDDEEEDEEEEGGGIVRAGRAGPRGYEDSDSDDSLDEQQFANLEDLMAELDEAAIHEAHAEAHGAQQG